jgi:hypothetical protein
MKQDKTGRIGFPLSRVEGLQRKIVGWLNHRSNKLSKGTKRFLLVVFITVSTWYCVWLILGEGNSVDFKAMEHVSYMRLRILPDKDQQPMVEDTGRVPLEP